MRFNSTVLTIPGLGNSGEGHWQTLWEQQFPKFIRVRQNEWENARCDVWITALDDEVSKHSVDKVILVGHSLACATIAFWSLHFGRKIKGALLVSPSDTEAATFPVGPEGFSPMPLMRLAFPAITVVSNNDFYVTPKRAKYFAEMWGSELINIGDAGHINVTSGFGKWNEGLELLKSLDTD